MKTFNLFLLLCLGLMGIAAQTHALSLSAEVEVLLESGGKTQTGEDETVGVWFIAIGTAEVAGKPEKSALTLAELEAKKELATFLSQTIEATSSYTYEESDGSIKENHSSSMQSRVNAFLRGIRIAQREIKNGLAIAVAVTTEKTIDASDLLAQKIEQDGESCIEASGDGNTFDEALASACRNALSQAFGYTVVASDSVSEGETLRSRMFSDIKGSVSAYRILEQRIKGGRHYVRIVAEINKGEPEESYGAQMKSFGDPLFYLEAKNKEAQTLLTDWFIGKGFKMTRTPTNADYKIEVSTKFSKVKHPANRKAGTQLLMKLVCYDKGGVRMFSLQSNPKKAASFVGTEERQAQITVEKAMAQIENPLHKRIQSAVNDMVNNGRSVRLVFQGIKSGDQIRAIESLCDEIAEIPGAGVATYSFNDDVQVATIRFDLKGNPADFVSQLRERAPSLPSPVSVNTNKIVFDLNEF